MNIGKNKNIVYKMENLNLYIKEALVNHKVKFTGIGKYDNEKCSDYIIVIPYDDAYDYLEDNYKENMMEGNLPGSKDIWFFRFDIYNNEILKKIKTMEHDLFEIPDKRFKFQSLGDFISAWETKQISEKDLICIT